MTQKLGQSSLLSVVGSLITILVALFALAALAQTTRTRLHFEQPKFIRASGDGVPSLPTVNLPQVSLSGNRESPSAKPGLFYSTRWYYSGGFWAHSVAVADVNGDGKMDLVAGNHTGTIGVLLGNAKKSRFDPVVTYDAAGIPYSVAVADVNGDGKPDVLAASNGAAVLLGNGDGTFQPAVAYDTGGVPLSIAVADVNRDGDPDLVVANAGSVAVLLGNALPANTLARWRLPM